MIDVDEYLTQILAAVRPIEETAVPLAEALGRTLRVPVHAAVDMPLFDNSAMDGFAVRFADVARRARHPPSCSGSSPTCPPARRRTRRSAPARRPAS